jgi:hypothetical protein
MVTFYFTNLKALNILEFFLQITLFYNFVQLLRQTNFYFLLAYFLTFILFLGIQLIIYSLDLVAIILWIIYGGVIIIFFVYSLMWVDFSKNEYYSNKFKLFYSGFINFFVFLFFYFLNLEEGFEFKLLTFRYFDFYLLLNQSNLEELEGLGWSLIYFTTSFFLLLSYFLFVVCCTAITIVLNAKKIKYNNQEDYVTYFKNFITKFNFNFYKIQNFFIQDYDSLYKIYTNNRISKIDTKFHGNRFVYKRI